jgi:hypothetical protein
MVSALAPHFGPASGWWFVPLSSRDHFGSKMQDAFQHAARVKIALTAGKNITVTCDDGDRAAALAGMALASGNSVTADIQDRITWLGHDIVRKWRRTIIFASRMLKLLRNWWAGRVYGPWWADSTGYDVIIVAPLHLPLQYDQDGAVRDTYFADLPSKLAAAGERVLITGPLLADPFAHAQATRGGGSVQVLALDNMISLGDVLALALKGVFSWLFPPRPPRLVDGPMPGLSRLIAREISDALEQRLHGAQLERAFANLLSRNPNARVIHTYENNYWERSINRPARDARPIRRTVGYVHAPVLESFLKNHVAAEEGPYRPAPQYLVCTGPAARDRLLTVGDYDPSSVAPGCALRVSNLSYIRPRTQPPRPIATILVLLEGLPTTPRFLRFVNETLPFLSGRRVVVRAHPVFPLEAVAHAAGVHVAPSGRLEASSGGSLEDDIAAADAVFFKSSSTVLVAGYMGIPIIRYRDDWWLNDDPLRSCGALKFEVQRPEELAGAVSAIEAMTDQKFERDRDALRAYIEGYLAAPSQSALSPFFER